MQTTGQNKQDTLKKHTSEHESIFGGIHSSMLMSANTELRGMETGGLHNSCTAADQLGSNCGQNRGKCSCKTPEPQQLPLFIERMAVPAQLWIETGLTLTGTCNSLTKEEGETNQVQTTHIRSPRQLRSPNQYRKARNSCLSHACVLKIGFHPSKCGFKEVMGMQPKSPSKCSGKFLFHVD